MKLRLLNNIDTLKSTDNATEIQLSVIDETEEIVDLSRYANISVAIGYQGTRYSSETPLIAEDHKSLNIVLSNALPEGKYNVEVILTKEDETYHIAPNEGVFILTIEKSLSEVGTSVTVISVQELIDDMAEVRRLSEESNANVTEALNNINELLEHVGETNAADVKVADADNNFITDNVENALAELASKVNDTIPASEKGVANGVAILNEEGKVIDADGNVVAGSGDGSDVDLSEYAKTSDVDEKDTSVLNAAKSYADEQVAGIPGVDLSEYAKSSEVDTKDAAILQSAKEYTDSKAGGATEVTKESIGLGNVNNTSDLNKPISIATQGALDHLAVKVLDDNTDLNTLIGAAYEGTYFSVGKKLTNRPLLSTIVTLQVLYDLESDVTTQIFMNQSAVGKPSQYIRYYDGEEWGTWFSIDNTPLSSKVIWVGTTVRASASNYLDAADTWGELTGVTSYPYSLGVSFICPSDWSPAAGDIYINIKGFGDKLIKNPDGTTPTLYPNAIYTIKGMATTNFILQGEGGGQATTSQPIQIVGADSYTINMSDQGLAIKFYVGKSIDVNNSTTFLVIREGGLVIDGVEFAGAYLMDLMEYDSGYMSQAPYAVFKQGNYVEVQMKMMNTSGLSNASIDQLMFELTIIEN